MGIEPISGMSPCRSTVLKTATPSDATPEPAKTSHRMSGHPCLSPAYGPSELTHDLAEIIDAWPDLPEPIRAGILAMIRSASRKR
jgi:hypothetical protein